MASVRLKDGGGRKVQSRGLTKSGSWDEADKGWDGLPHIKTDWVQQAATSPSGNRGGQVMYPMYKKDGMMPTVMQSNVVHVTDRLSRTFLHGGEEEDFMKLPRLSTKTGRSLDTVEGANPDLSNEHLNYRRAVDRTTLPYNYVERHNTVANGVPPLVLHVARPDVEDGNIKHLSKNTIYPHDPQQRNYRAPMARTRNGREARMAIPLEQGGMFMCELDRAAMDGSLLQCIAGETYTFGVSLRYGYGHAKTGTDLDRQMLEDWMIKQGGISAYLTGEREIACNCTHVAEGAYAFAFAATKIGAYKLWVFVGSNSIPGSPFDVHYHAAPPCARSCFISGLGLWSAEVGVEASFDWVATDEFGNRSDRGGDPFKVAFYSAEEVVVRLRDNEDGSYTATYVATIAGQQRVAVTLNGAHLPGSPFLVTVREGKGDPAMSTVTGEGLEDCVVGTDRHFLIEAVDKHGNRVQHGGDSFVAELTGPVPERVHLIDMDDGTYAGTYMCRWAGDFQFNVYLSGTAVADSPYRFHVRPGPTLAQNCECTLVKMPMSRLVAIAGTPCSFTIFAKDKFGNQRDDGGDEFFVKCRGPTNVVQAFVTDNKDGTYLVEFTCTIEGEYFIDVKRERIDIMNSPFLLTVDPAPTDAVSCTARGIDTEFGNGLKNSQAGREVKFLIQAVDKFGNRVRKPGDDFQVKIVELSEDIRVRAKVVDNGDGSYECTWKGMVRGEYEVAVALKDDAIAGSPWKVVVRTGDAAAAKSTAEGSGLGGGFAGVPNSVLVEANDHYGNVVTNGGANVEAQLISVDGRINLECVIKDEEDGTYTVTYCGTVSCEYFLAIRIDGEHIHESPFLIFIDHTDTDPATCRAEGRHSEGDGLRFCLSGSETGFQLFAYDCYGNRCTVGGDVFFAELKGLKDVAVDILDHQDGHYTCTYTAIWSGEYQLHVSLDSIEIAGSPWTVTSHVGALDAVSCYIHGAGISAGIAGVEMDLHVQAKDRFENNRPEEDEVQVYISGPEKVTIKRRYLGDGQYDFFWTGNKTGVYDVDVVCQGLSLGTAPYTVTVGSGEVYPVNCIAFGDGIKKGKAGETCTFVIQSRDMFGNDRTRGGDRYRISIDGPASVEARVKDNENGKYTCQFTTMVKGAYWLYITLGKEDISGSPFLCEVSPAEVDVATSKAEGMGLLVVGTFKTSTFKIYSYDKYGNELDAGGDPWEVSIIGSEMPETTILDNNDGTYTVTYMTQSRGNLNVYIGIKGFELRDCPFDVFSDTKIRRKLAIEKQQEREAKNANTAARRQAQILDKQKSGTEQKQTSKGLDLNADLDDDETEAPPGKVAKEGEELAEEYPKRGTAVIDMTTGDLR